MKRLLSVTQNLRLLIKFEIAFNQKIVKQEIRAKKFFFLILVHKINVFSFLNKFLSIFLKCFAMFCFKINKKQTEKSNFLGIFEREKVFSFKLLISIFHKLNNKLSVRCFFCVRKGLSGERKKSIL